ncbi:MAG: LITAF-like zinc ribbon domain-containing protein [Promethearchaeia archaeon]
MGNKTEKYAYCPFCEREVVPVKKKMNPLGKTIWTIIIISTLGFALIPLIIYLKFIKKRKHCPKCEMEVEWKEKTQIGHPKEDYLLEEKEIEDKEEKKGKEDGEEDEEEEIYCPFCGSEINEDIVTCPYCKTVIKY